MDAETGFSMDGVIYPVPDLGTFNMDEAQILYDYSGLSMEDFVVPLDESDEDREVRERRMRNPGFLRALMHIAYQRGNPDVRPTRVKALIGNANVMDALSSLVEDEDDQGDAANPPDMTPAPSESSRNDWDGSNGNSGGDSTSASDEQGVDPANIGTTKSPISPTFDPMTLD